MVESRQNIRETYDKLKGWNFVARRLFAIGINNYQDYSDIFKPDLKYSHSDAHRVSSLFKETIFTEADEQPDIETVETITDETNKNPWENVE